MTLRMLRSACFVTVILSVLAFPHDAGIDLSARVYHTPENIEAAGYVVETHHVTTSDGYILEMHRIPYRRHESEGSLDRPVVFMLHGLFGASSTFVSLGPEYAMSYNLADAGYDVWLGNARGNRLSRSHVTLSPDAREDRLEFWDFSWEEIGIFDIPAMMDYILDHTDKEQLHFVAHSQGGTAFLVLNSMRPEYNEKFKSVHLLAATGYMNHFPNEILRTAAQLTNTIYNLAVRIGFVEVFPPWLPRPTDIKDLDIYAYCAGDIKLKDFCKLIGIEEIMGKKIVDIPIPGLPNLFLGAGSSFKQVAHYGQNIKDQSFRRWDYGETRNMDLYGTSEPPMYDLSRITAKVTMHYSVSDELLDERDVHAMASEMPNTEVRQVAREDFSHFDFHSSNDVKELITVYIIESIAIEEGLLVPTPPTEGSSESDDEGKDSNEDSSNEDSSNEDSNEDGSASSIFLGLVLKIYLVIYTLHCIV